MRADVILREMQAVVPSDDLHDYNVHLAIFNMVIEYVDNANLNASVTSVVKHEVRCCLYTRFIYLLSFSRPKGSSMD